MFRLPNNQNTQNNNNNNNTQNNNQSNTQNNNQSNTQNNNIFRFNQNNNNNNNNTQNNNQLNTQNNNIFGFNQNNNNNNQSLPKIISNFNISSFNYSSNSSSNNINFPKQFNTIPLPEIVKKEINAKELINDIGNEWSKIIEQYINIDILNNVLSKYQNTIIYPEQKNIFRAFKFVKPSDIKVVILGQDPYINPGEANGLSFSAGPITKNEYAGKVKLPPSLRNVFKNIQTNYTNFIIPNHSNLVGWANQGVLLLNSGLTVEKSKPGSHIGIKDSVDYWSYLTDKIIEYISENCEHVVFMLWGSFAKKKAKFIKNAQIHFISESMHPSPQVINSDFHSTPHFYNANKFLISYEIKPIDWTNLPEYV